MKTALLFTFTGLILFSCMSDAEVALKEKELELKERELELKERSMDLNQGEQESTQANDIKHSEKNVEKNSSSETATESSLSNGIEPIEEQADQEKPSPSDPNATYSNPSQPSTEQSTYQSPFSGNGTGGSGTGGTGSGFGSDDVPGTGSGDAGSINRVRLSNLKSNPITLNDQRCTIALKLTVDSRGKVVRANVIKANTTTTNQPLIDEVIALVKKEVRYKEKPGARNETAYYNVTVQPGL